MISTDTSQTFWKCHTKTSWYWFMKTVWHTPNLITSRHDTAFCTGTILVMLNCHYSLKAMKSTFKPCIHHWIQNLFFLSNIACICHYKKNGQKCVQEPLLRFLPHRHACVNTFDSFSSVQIPAWYQWPGLGSSKVLVLGTWCKISSTWYLLVLDTLKFKSTWYLLVLEGKVLYTCPSTFKYFCQIKMYIQT